MQGSTFKPVQVSQFTSDKLSFNGMSANGSVLAGQTANIDLLMTDDNLITGVVMNTQNATFGDYVSLQVVAVNSTLASSLGVPVNTVLNQFATNWRLRSDAQRQLDFELDYPAKLLAFMTLRAVYTSVASGLNALPVNVNINYMLHLVHV